VGGLGGPHPRGHRAARWLRTDDTPLRQVGNFSSSILISIVVQTLINIILRLLVVSMASPVYRRSWGKIPSTVNVLPQPDSVYQTDGMRAETDEM
jgi:hypothetical protein